MNIMTIWKAIKPTVYENRKWIGLPSSGKPLPCPSREPGRDNYAYLTEDGTLKRKQKTASAKATKSQLLSDQRVEDKKEQVRLLEALLVSIETA